MSPATRPAAPCCAWVSAKTSTVSPSPAGPARRAPSWSSALRGARCAPGRSGAENRSGRWCAKRRRLKIASRAGVGNLVGRHQPVPDEQHHQRADHGADETGALILAIPADRLADEGCEEGAGDAEHRGENEARRIVRPRRQEARDDAGDKTDDDDPEYVHGDLAMNDRP